MKTHATTIALVLTVMSACDRSATPRAPQPNTSRDPIAPPSSSGVPIGPVSSSASAAPSASAPNPAGSEIIDLSEPNEDEFSMHDERPRPSPRVEAELAQWEEYEQLPPLRRLPDFLSVDDVMALFPDDSEHAVRDEIHTQLEGAETGPLRGSYLDPQQEQLFVLWVHGNLLQALAVYDGKRLASKREVSRGQAVLDDVVSEDGESRSEILIRRITSMSVCCHPMSLEVLRVSKRGRLDEVLDFPLGYAEVGPGVRWSFLNHFEFTGDRVVIHDVTDHEGPHYELVFDPRSARFQPTPATAKLLRQERARNKAEADGADALMPGGDPGY